MFLCCVLSALATAAYLSAQQPDPKSQQPTRIIAFDPAEWQKDLLANSKRDFSNILPGIDLSYSGRPEKYEASWKINPGAYAKNIQLQFKAIQSSRIDAEGRAVVETNEGSYTLGRPMFSQEISSNTVKIDGWYRELADQKLAVSAGSYDPRKPMELKVAISFQPKAKVLNVISAPSAPAAVTITAPKVDTLLTDVDGDGKADPGDTLRYDVTVSDTGSTDATGVQFADTLDTNTTLVGGSVNVSPLAFNDSYSTIGNTLLEAARPASGNPAVVSAVKVTDNDVEFLGDTFTLTTITNGASTNGGVVNLFADGSFTYLPPVGSIATDTFTYTLTDSGGLTGTGTVTITISNRVWYVNNAGAAGDGRSTSPFQTLAPVNGAGGAGDSDAANDIIYIFTGAGNYTTGIELESGEQLIETASR